MTTLDTLMIYLGVEASTVVCDAGGYYESKKENRVSSTLLSSTPEPSPPARVNKMLLS